MFARVACEVNKPIVEARVAVSAQPADALSRSSAATTTDRSSTARSWRRLPILEPGPEAPSRRFAERLEGRHPVTVFFAALLPGYALLVGISVALGVLLTRVLLHVDAIAGVDERFPEWLAGHRTHFLVDMSWVGSTLVGGLVIPIVIGAVLVVSAISRCWRVGIFVLFAVAVESGTYRATTLLIHRHRPDVPRLEGLDANASYPSGHSAASIALFCGMALLLSSRARRPAARIAIWAVALAIPPFVAISRMIRGMHHPLDVADGVVIGIGALIVVLFATRAAGVAARQRKAHT